MRRGGWSRRKRNERKDEYPEEGGRLGVEGIVEGERVVGEDSRDGLFDLRSRLPSLRFQLFSSFLTIFLLLFFSSSRGGNCERERGREDENFAGSMEKKIESQRCERFIRYSYGCYTSKYVKYMRAIYRGMCICMSYIVFALLFFFFFYSRFDLS